MTAEHFTSRIEAALRRWLDYCSRMSAADLAALAAGARVSVALCMDVGDLDSAGCFDAMAELVDAMGAARAATDEENAR